MRRNRSAGRRSLPASGFTLIEMIIAVTLVAAIVTGLLMSMRTGLTAYQRVTQRLEDNRRAMGIDQALHRQFGGIMPVTAPCGGDGAKVSAFIGAVSWMRCVSSSSLEEGARGYPHIIEYSVISDPDGGVRLMSNEGLYTGPSSFLNVCSTSGPFLPSDKAVKMAGKLAYCRFGYRVPVPESPLGGDWAPAWQAPDLPRAVRIEMRSLGSNPGKLPILDVNVPIHVTRQTQYIYTDE